MKTPTPERTLTELDHVRLLNLLRRASRGPAPSWHALEELLDLSTLVPPREVPSDVITMHTQVRLQDGQTDEGRTLTLCYPEQADAACGRVSVLSPVGSALLGLRVGRVARWTRPSGDVQSARIEAVLFQPEASGLFTM